VNLRLPVSQRNSERGHGLYLPGRVPLRMIAEMKGHRKVDLKHSLTIKGTLQGTEQMKKEREVKEEFMPGRGTKRGWIFP